MVDRDEYLMSYVPRDLCGIKLQKKFIELKKNQVTRRVRNLIHEKTLNEWQLPQLKNQVESFRKWKVR